MISGLLPCFGQAGVMDPTHLNQNLLFNWSAPQSLDRDRLRRRLSRWQHRRTWARLIREAESLWHVDVRAIRRLGAIELSQLLHEVPPSQRKCVNRWLRRYSVLTRFEGPG